MCNNNPHQREVYPGEQRYPTAPYSPTDGDYYPPASSYPQGTYPPASGYPQGAYPPTSGYPQGAYPPTSGYPQGAYPPTSGNQQGSYPPTSGYPQGTYPPTSVDFQGTLPPASGSPLEANHNQGQPERMSSNQYSSPGEDPTQAFDFSEKSIRLNFIRKVYSILTVQLLISVAFVALFIFDKKVNKYFKHHIEYEIIAIIIVLVLVFTMACVSSVRRKAPMNFICLFVFTIAFSFLTATIAAQYDAIEVMLAMIMTAAITIGLTMVAFQSKVDFTGCGGALFAILMVFVIGGIFCAIFPSRALHALYAGIGAILMSFYIVYDTQLMMGGSHKYSISPEEYIFAALNLYLDIINLFLYILQFIGRRK